MKRMSLKGEPLVIPPCIFSFPSANSLAVAFFFGVQGVCKSFGAFEDEDKFGRETRDFRRKKAPFLFRSCEEIKHTMSIFPG